MQEPSDVGGRAYGRVFLPWVLQGFPGPPSEHGGGTAPFPFSVTETRASKGKGTRDEQTDSWAEEEL